AAPIISKRSVVVAGVPPAIIWWLSPVCFFAADSPLDESVRRRTRLPLQLWRSGAVQSASAARTAPTERSGYSFGARELTIFSKRGSPRSGSYQGISFKRP